MKYASSTRILRGHAIRVPYTVLRTFLACAAIGTIACSDSTIEPTPHPIKSFDAEGQAIEVARGSSKTMFFVIGRDIDFKGDVTLTVEGVPEGLRASFGPRSLKNPDVQSILTVTALPAAAAGTYRIVARAAGSQIDSKTRELDVTVTIPSIAISTSSLATVAQGDTVPITVSVTRAGGYSGPVSLFASGLPEGVTGKFDKTTLSADESSTVFRIAASLVAQPISKAIVINASGTGVDSKQSSIDLSVALSSTPRILLSTDPAAIFLTDSTLSGEVVLKVGRSGGYSGSVSFSLLGLPSGATAQFDPQTTSSSESRLKVSIPMGFPLGSSDMMVRASGSSVADVEQRIVLQVNAAPDYSLSLTDSSMTIAAGASGSNSLNIQKRGGLTDGGTITFMGYPSGITSSLPPTFTSSGSSALVAFTVTVASSVASGSYAGVIRVRSTSGQYERTVPLLITVP